MPDLTKIEVKYWGAQDSKLDSQFDEIARKQGLFFDNCGYCFVAEGDTGRYRRDLIYTSE